MTSCCSRCATPNPAPFWRFQRWATASSIPAAPTATSPTISRTSVEDLWRDDLVAFLIGCSFSFESELIEAGIEMRHNTQGRNVSMYITNIACEPAGKMSGNMVVSMRPIPYEQVVRAVQISGAIPKVHGAPIHIGDPSVIGIDDISKPDFGDAVDIHEGEVPVFWPCGVTPQSVVMNVKPKFAITHAPGCMLITDTKNISLKF